jgi:D-glycero-alpha-D-manno-heptose 1-phosphate guanylyltransferase
MDAIILAGGLGTRLRSVVNDLPKCMAPVAGKPFLYYVLTNLERQGITSIVLSVGYLMEHIFDYIDNNFAHLDVKYAIETEPLGTGGAIYLSCLNAQSDHVLVLNGDSFFDLDFISLYKFHLEKNAEASLALKPMRDFERYGTVECDFTGKILSFIEKQRCSEGTINGGVYLIDKNRFLNRTFETKFSIENDYFNRYIGEGVFYGCAFDGFFIDIGIPEDLAIGQELFKDVFKTKS